MRGLNDYLDEEIPRLLRLLDGTDVSELVLEGEGVRLRVRREPGDVIEAAEAGPVPHEEEPQLPEIFEVVAPLVGTFYRAAQPGGKPFVKVGDHVEPGQQVAIVEAMKLMNPVEADRPGCVAEFLLPDGTAVEYGQALIAIVSPT